jgi:hypothetical protein
MDPIQKSVVPQKSFGCLHVLLIFIVILLVAILGSMWWLKRNMYAAEFKPTRLTPAEQITLDAKVRILDQTTVPSITPDNEPEPYVETPESRRISFSEKELNALLARDADIARRVFIDLSDDLLSVKVIAPMDQEIPLVGGKTFKLNIGLTLRYDDGKPTVIIRGVSLGGIPLPGAWWGDIKNKNLVEVFGQDGGFWDTFSKGVEYLEVKDGQFILHLKE